MLVSFRFAAGGATKRRPAVILSVEDYHNSRIDTIMMALTTQRGNLYYGDCDLVDWRSAGLPKPTKAKGVLQTIERGTIVRQLGSLSPDDLQRVQIKLKAIFGL